MNEFLFTDLFSIWSMWGESSPDIEQERVDDTHIADCLNTYTFTHTCTSSELKKHNRVFVELKPVKHGQQLLVRWKDNQWIRFIVDLQVSVDSRFKYRKCFIRDMGSVIEYVFLFFLSCIQYPHYTADMQHHIKCDHREQKPGHSRFQTTERLIINLAHAFHQCEMVLSSLCCHQIQNWNPTEFAIILQVCFNQLEQKVGIV